MDFFSRIPLGGNDEYKLFTPMYFIALFVCLIILFLLYKNLYKIKGKKYEIYIRIIMSAYMLYTSINIWSFYFLNDLPWYSFIPEGTCGFAILTGVYALLTKSKLAFKITFFWGWGGFLALFAPNILEGPNHYFFYQFYIRHMLIVVSAFYMMKVHDYQVSKSDFKIYVYVTLPLALVGLGINYIVNDPENLNLLFMMVPPIDGTPLDILYDVHPLFYSSVWILIAFVFGYLYPLPFYTKSKAPSTVYS